MTDSSGHQQKVCCPFHALFCVRRYAGSFQPHLTVLAAGMNKEVLEASAASTVSGFQSSGASSRYTEDEGAVDTFSGPGKGFYEGYWRAKYSRDNADVYGGGEGSVRWRAKKTTSFVQSFGGAVPGHYQTSLAAYATTMTASPVRTVAKKGPLHVR